ncbi:DDE domain-containing protein (plasmid) [Paraburkholderia pallida]|uniref:DDE domain-containing protein n=1 Tax=Paraburkholderia pallida TaxID=2547399 RepID=A0A4P7DBH7_9BURK|nr:DDE domain-containing protein [Paraburkholderia pallida]
MAAVDERGAKLGILVQKRRDKAAAERFFSRARRSCPLPRKIVTDQLHAPNAVLTEVFSKSIGS